MPHAIVTTDAPTTVDRDGILAPLIAHNEGQAGASGFKLFAVLIRNDEGKTIGGLWARSGFDWLYVELLAVPSGLRGQGLGSRLMQQAEAEAVARGCIGVWVDTYAFQAPDFYRKLGYEVFGTIEDYPRKSRRIFFQKRLAAATP